MAYNINANEVPNYRSPDFDEKIPVSTKFEEEINDSPIEEVRLTVPATDDPTLPCFTFRTWILGLVSCILLSFVNQFFSYRQNQIGVGSVCVQILALPIGRMMAATLPSKSIKVPFTNWSFSLNSGPFNMKEHALITIFASAGAGGVYGLYIIDIVKAFYHRNINPAAGFLLSQTTQLLGFGWAGLFRKYLVDSPYMWWPASLIQISVFRTMHEEEKRPKGGLTRLQFFVIFLIASFAYYIIPNFFFPAIMSLSFICWIWKNSVTAHQIGSGLKGLGVGSFGIDWSTVVAFMPSPLASPAVTIYNSIAGYILFVFVLVPIGYWSNSFNAKLFPLYSSHVFDSTGRPFNITLVLNEKTFSLDLAEYESYSKINLSIFFAYSYGLGFATLTATITYVALYHGRTIWQLWRRTTSNTEQHEDIHVRIMKRNYESVPQLWFIVILVIVIGLAFFTCEGFNKQLQLPYWGIILACAMAFIFTLPIGVITATTNMQPGLNIITEMVIGFLYPGRPLANVVFKTYGYISMSQALTFLNDFKVGHYMKIPPKTMFFTQIVGTLLSTSVYFCTCWWLLTSIPHICQPENLPDGSPWTCPNDDVFYNVSIIWGVVGPLRMFGHLGLYYKLNWFFLFGLLAQIPFWYLTKKLPHIKWLGMVNLPVILSATSGLPPGRTVNFNSWIVVALVFNVWVFKHRRAWWVRYNYVLAAALDAGTAFMAVVGFLALGSFDVNSVEWWGGVTDDYCPLAKCPTAYDGYLPEGCPMPSV